MVITEDMDWISVLNDVCYAIFNLHFLNSLVHRTIWSFQIQKTFANGS